SLLLPTLPRSTLFPYTTLFRSVSNWSNLYAEVLGIVNQPQTLYTRNGPQLTLQPLGTQAFDKSIIPFYNVYFSDTWRMRPTFTRSEEHTSELQSRGHLVCRLLL